MSAVTAPRTGRILLGTIRPDRSIRYALDAVGIDFPVGYIGVNKCCIVLCVNNGRNLCIIIIIRSVEQWKKRK